MLLLMLALLQASAPSEEARATLQSCQTTDKGWVCHYQMPTEMTVKPLEGQPPVVAPPASVELAPAASAKPTAEKPVSEKSVSEKPVDLSRQTRLIARCGDAKWYSACLPGERKEAQLLKEAAAKSEALRGKVTGLLSENRCDDAVKAALEGGDLPLAREARAFCAPQR
ncbi:hypothetical protein CA606_08365 [Caulobacter vibrioides]|uniref:Uncharacterized protein n=1 Tax=Caulobacter vibrioides TaxID=155892 RepID=A0A290MKQ9_CAUVI|nr:hypothetical protein [Caulobacter vibrioides]ATC32364.1 hypothetical protein CA606_08365 [Caulobacter vibrioides]